MFTGTAVPYSVGIKGGETFKDIAGGRSPGRTEYTPPIGDPSGLETRPKNIALIYAIKW
jgi:hypothetical protein